jgi:rare lipoprotein A
MERTSLAAFAVVLACSGAMADEYGQATYYSNPQHPGLIAAHRTLPFGTHVRVHNLDNGRSAIVVIVDRGPFARGRIIDVSTVAAGLLGMRQSGVAHVRLERLQGAVEEMAGP